MAVYEAADHNSSDPFIPADTFALRLVAVRHELGLTQAEAAGRCGLDDGSWSNWERGAQPRNLVDVVDKIHTALGPDRDWLMWGQNRKDMTGPDLRLVHSEEPAPGPGQQELPFPRLTLVPD